MVASEAIQVQIIRDRQEKVVFEQKRNATVSYDNLSKRLMGFLPGAEEVQVMHLLHSGQPGRTHGIIYGDDFLKNLIPYLSQLFSRLDVILADSLPSRQYGEDISAGDLILLERAESKLGTTRIEIDKIFSIFEAEALIPIRYPHDLQTIIPGANVSLNHGPDGLEIKSVGIQSVFKFKSIPPSDGNVFRVLKLTIEASHSDIMTVKYMTSAPRVVPKSLKSGVTELYLPLPFQKTSSLNIHPGNKAGVLTLRSAEVLAFTDSPGSPPTVAKEDLGCQHRCRGRSVSSACRNRYALNHDAAGNQYFNPEIEKPRPCPLFRNSPFYRYGGAEAQKTSARGGNSGYPK